MESNKNFKGVLYATINRKRATSTRDDYDEN